ncbi:FAD-dependent oxidoreductase [Prosthecomicrobium hirschii]|uniref:FAD-dependent oxidoreductase n=1 Tax=Prosthecodimorpha hirschii TaxID=665126 RepID=UPI0022203EDA|nr:FAD-dependent oxidoreductase [Prosthecomicrobium hirschii]MCW1843641.1 FAD-dependent oxidoreductase [Prosthecomicrobium hirschii]
MQRYSIYSLVRNALTHHEGWQRAWRSPPLKRRYQIVIVGAGGHGLSTAYHLAKEHGLTDVAVLEKGWLGGGNTARNTHTIRSNYIRDVSIRFHDVSVKLYEQMSRELNFNILFSQRSMIDLIQSFGKLRDLRRRSLAMALHGPQYQLISVDELQRRIPAMGSLDQVRLPPLAGMVHPEAAMARHDAVAWSYARAADARGVEIHQHTEVTGFIRGPDGAVTGVETNRGTVSADIVALATAGSTSDVARRAGISLPLVTRNLQAFVSEPVKPLIDVIVNCPDVGLYLMQSDKGEIVIGGGTDPYPSYRQGSHFATFEDTVASLVELFPRFKALKMLRQWGGAIEFAYDASPIISKTDLPGLLVSTGWYGGFKSIPVGGLTFAHLIATGTPHPLAEAFGLDRFTGLKFLLEAGTVAQR